MFRALASLCGVLLLNSGVAASTLSVTAQSRAVVAEANASNGQGEFGHPSDSVTFLEPGYFGESVAADIAVSNGFSSAESEQESSMSEVSISASGSFFTESQSGYLEPGYANGHGDSRFLVYFTLTEASGYTLTGEISEGGQGSTQVELREPGVGGSSLHLFVIPSNEETWPFSVTGVLPAGTYSLSARAQGNSVYNEYNVTETASGAFDLLFLLDAATDAPVVASPQVLASPNPFRTSTRLQLPKGAVSASILDASGRLVLELLGTATWDGRDSLGRSVPSGVYFVRAEGVGAEVTKVVRLK